MAQESFSKEFDKLRELGEKVFVLRGSTIIVEILPPEDIKVGSIVVATVKDQVKGGINAHRLEVGRVLMTGPGYWDEEKNEYEPLDVKPGAVVILPQYSTQHISQFPGINRLTDGRLGLVKMGEILAYYPSEEAFEKAKKKIN